MKHIKLFESFKNIGMINEEWYPRGPWMKNKELDAICEIFDGRDGGIYLEFIAGGKVCKNHLEEIKGIIDSLSKGIEDFELHGILDCNITNLSVYIKNLKDIEAESKEYLSSLGELTSYGNYYTVKLKNPIKIIVPESNEKNEIIFSNKLNKLERCLGNYNIDNTKESNELIDKLISLFYLE
jgi:hypothetical protein